MLSGTAFHHASFRFSPLRLLPLLLALLLTGCGLLPSGTSPGGPLKGEITTSDGAALPPNSELEVFLQEETESDIIGPIVAHEQRAISGRPPWSFQLKGDKPLQAQRLHVLRARILQDGRILYEKVAAVPVMTLGHPTEVQLELQRRPSE
ncbi:MAG: YbaY family lipoprotein [Pseudomonadota bacterium]